MADTADIVIIGAGINGTSLAFHLAKEKAGKIVVLERAQFSAGSTGKSGGLIRCHYTNQPEARLALDSLRYFENWRDVVGGDCGFRRAGLLVLVAPDKQANLEHNVQWQRAMGIDTRLVSRDEARAIDPALCLDDGVQVAAYEACAGYADPNAANYAFARAARDMGVEFRIGVDVRSILHRDGRVTGISTSGGDVLAPNVVVVAGAWANALFSPLKIDLGLVPAMARICLFRWTPDRSPGHPMYLDHIHRTWYRPTEDSCTLAGAELGIRRAPNLDRWSESVSQTFIERCRSLMTSRFPSMHNASIRGNLACVFMESADDRPLIGAILQYAGLFTIAGDSGTSFKTAPAIGKALAELIVHGQSRSVDLDPFRPARFAEGQPWKDEHGYTVKRATISR